MSDLFDDLTVGLEQAIELANEKEDIVKQYIVVRKDACTVTGEPVSAHKLAVMVAHASMAFLSNLVLENEKDGHVAFDLDEETHRWLTGIFTKVLLEAKNLRALEKVVAQAKENGLVEGRDYFCIRDNCLTELLPDEGSVRCFVAVGFRPMDVKRLRPVVKRLQLYR